MPPTPLSLAPLAIERSTSRCPSSRTALHPFPRPSVLDAMARPPAHRARFATFENLYLSTNSARANNGTWIRVAPIEARSLHKPDHFVRSNGDSGVREE